VEYVYGISDRRLGVSAQFGIYDKNFNKLNVDRLDERHQDDALPKPKNYDKMVEIAEKLSGTFPEVRADLYNINGTIYFGELTFYDGSGYMRFSPDSFDFEMGQKFDISTFSD
jgi:acid phosphatase class B